MSTAASREGKPDDQRFGVVVLCLLGALGLVAWTIERVVRRLGFDYDLVLWSDDYFMTSMLKLHAGEPLYSSIADANSTIYAPGGPYVHHALLGPLGLDGSLLANKILVQVWLFFAVFVGTAAVTELARSRGVYPEAGPRRLTFVGLVFLTLALSAFTNPTADSLHPGTLELLVLGAAQLAFARWDRASIRYRYLALALLPPLGLLAKQTCGVALLLACSWVALRELRRAPPVHRWPWLTLPAATFCAALAALTWWTDGMFKVWGFDILSKHHFDWWKVSDLYEGYGLLFYPVVGVVLYGAVAAFRGGTDADRDWRRAASVAVFYAPFALTALFKAMGGPNNLAVVGYAVTVLALPLLLGEVFRKRSGLLPLVALGIVATQIALWYPRRRVPDDLDFRNAATVCRYAASRMKCGEEVLVGRGAVCYARGGVAIPRDRVMSIIEVSVAGYESELEFYDRVTRMEYDLMIFPMNDLQWFGRPLWELIQGKYKAFYMTMREDKLDGDFWYHGWQGFSSKPIVFFERTAEAGRHEVSDAGMRCDHD